MVADMPETWRLWETINAWWAEIEVFLITGVTNARTEAANTSIKHLKRTGRGYRNAEHYKPVSSCAVPPDVRHEHQAQRPKSRRTVNSLARCWPLLVRLMHLAWTDVGQGLLRLADGRTPASAAKRRSAATAALRPTIWSR